MRTLLLSLCLMVIAYTAVAKDPATPVENYGGCAAYHLTKFGTVSDSAEKQDHLEKYAKTLNAGVEAGYTVAQIEQAAEQIMETVAADESGDKALDALASSCGKAAPVEDYGSCAAYHLTKFGSVSDNVEKQDHLEKYAKTLNAGVEAGFTVAQIEQAAEQSTEALAADESGDNALDALSSSCDNIE